MPKIIQTGETITLADLRVDQITFSWVQEPVEPATDPVTYETVMHTHVAYSRLKEDGSAHDSVVVEVVPDKTLPAAILAYYTDQIALLKSDEGI